MKKNYLSIWTTAIILLYASRVSENSLKLGQNNRKNNRANAVPCSLQTVNNASFKTEAVWHGRQVPGSRKLYKTMPQCKGPLFPVWTAFFAPCQQNQLDALYVSTTQRKNCKWAYSNKSGLKRFKRYLGIFSLNDHNLFIWYLDSLNLFSINGERRFNYLNEKNVKVI